MGGAYSTMFQGNHALLKQKNHRKQSNIQINNQQGRKAFTNSATQDSPYKYDMYFKSGLIDYNFMNKDASPCKVTVIAYRVKKTAKLSGDPELYMFASPTDVTSDCFY